MPDAILLCGGAGLRLKSVTGKTPKVMANISGRPFLQLPIRQLARHGFKRVVLAVGYQWEAILARFGDRAFGLELVYSRETSPLGTGGALRLAVNHIRSDCALVMNGDSYTNLDIRRLVYTHRQSKAKLTVAVVPGTRPDAGSLLLDHNRAVRGFLEKQQVDSRHYVNAGIYVINRDLAASIPPAVQISLEERIFPLWISEGQGVMAFVYHGACIDIGTPERYRNAQRKLSETEVEPFSARHHSSCVAVTAVNSEQPRLARRLMLLSNPGDVAAARDTPDSFKIISSAHCWRGRAAFSKDNLRSHFLI